MAQLEAVFKQGAGQEDFTAVSARTAGEIMEMEDGRAAVVKSNLAAGEKGSRYTLGIFDVKSATATTFAKGAPVIWDVSASLGIAGEGAEGDHFLGPTVAAKAAGVLIVRIDLNGVNNDRVKRVATKTAGYTILASQCGQCFTNTGSAGAIEFQLPAATPGLHYYFAVGVAQSLRIQPASGEQISLIDGIPGTADKYLEANAVEEALHLMCVNAGNWAVVGYTGTWTHEA